MKQTARVQKIFPDGTAQLIPQTFWGCGGECGRCGGCSSQTAFLANNPIQAKVGEFVEVQSHLSVWEIVLYLLPAALFFLGYYLGSLLRWEEGAACCGFLLGSGIAVWYFCLSGRRRLRYTITGYPSVWT